MTAAIAPGVRPPTSAMSSPRRRTRRRTDSASSTPAAASAAYSPRLCPATPDASKPPARSTSSTARLVAAIAGWVTSVRRSSSAEPDTHSLVSGRPRTSSAIAKIRPAVSGYRLMRSAAMPGRWEPCPGNTARQRVPGPDSPADSSATSPCSPWTSPSTRGAGAVTRVVITGFSLPVGWRVRRSGRTARAPRAGRAPRHRAPCVPLRPARWTTAGPGSRARPRPAVRRWPSPPGARSARRRVPRWWGSPGPRRSSRLPAHPSCRAPVVSAKRRPDPPAGPRTAARAGSVAQSLLLRVLRRFRCRFAVGSLSVRCRFAVGSLSACRLFRFPGAVPRHRPVSRVICSSRLFGRLLETTVRADFSGRSPGTASRTGLSAESAGGRRTGCPRPGVAQSFTAARWGVYGSAVHAASSAGASARG